MKRWLGMIAALIALVGIVAHETSRGQAPGSKQTDVGPGVGGATLKLPGFDPTPTPTSKPSVPDSLKGLWNPAANSGSPRPSGGEGSGVRGSTGKIALPASNRVDINKDIEITPAAGNWMIFAMAYTGPKAPEMARKFVSVMRSHYKMNAYVFNYGAKEKQAEYERVEKIRREQMEALQKQGLKADMPIRVTTVRIDEQTGVLVGGYKTREEALTALVKLRKLDPKALLDHGVDLDVKSVEELEGKLRKEAVYVNPFTKAFPSRNPSIEGDQANAATDEDLRYMRKINDGEPFSLLRCGKPYTLAVKQFNVQYKTLNGGDDGKREASGFIDRFSRGLTLKGGEWQDATALNAHNLGEAFRKGGFSDTYVLHLKYTSFVTIGAFASPTDPRLVAMQNHLESVFKTDAFQQRGLEMFPRPVVMRVPGVAAK